MKVRVAASEIVKMVMMAKRAFQSNYLMIIFIWSLSRASDGSVLRINKELILSELYLQSLLFLLR
ncbi:hypothetical protein ACSS6W_006667 [Trichoderma asperelloides]